jgi:hypothetical protein
MLSSEFQERSANLRFVFDQWMRYLTFFYGANMVAWGWFVSQFATNQTLPQSVWLVWIVSGFFIVEIFINISLARTFLDFLKASRERMEWLATRLSATDSAESRVQSPFPFQLAERVVWILVAGMIPMIGLWMSIAIFISIRSRL